jgi:hypothetical protein
MVGASVGGSVGNTDASLVGFRVEGNRVGSSDEVVLGTPVGRDDGGVVRREVGDEVGQQLGCTEGWYDGEQEGNRVGDEVGRLPGGIEGCDDG